MVDYFTIFVTGITIILLYQYYTIKKQKRENFGSAELLTMTKANIMTAFSDQLQSGVWEGDLVIDGDFEVNDIAVLNNEIINCGPTSDSTILNNNSNTTKYGSYESTEDFKNKWKYGSQNITDEIDTELLPIVIGGSGTGNQIFWQMKDGTRIMN